MEMTLRRVINKTFIVLIPKVSNPTYLSQFRPISLCNVTYKIISKVHVNRLKKILPELISPEQPAFVPGRLITDNVIAAYECLHFMKRSRSKNRSHCALKVDMMKAYDRVEWNYLEAVMLKLGFPSSWVTKIMNCVKSVAFVLLLNGCKQDEFRPTRGIQQGDPISPYLFFIVAEGLSCLLRARASNENVKGVVVAPTASAVNHLLFADDCLLMFRANEEGAHIIKNTIQQYCAASGQRVNYEKSSIFFGKGCPEGKRNIIKTILDVPNESLSEKYLGLPSEVGKSKNHSLNISRTEFGNEFRGG